LLFLLADADPLLAVLGALSVAAVDAADEAAAVLALSALLEIELSSCSDSPPSKSSTSKLTTPVDLRLGFFLR
jgi:hypothetical protein